MTEIRDATIEDQPAILAIYNDAVLQTTASWDYEPRSGRAQDDWFAAKRAGHWPVLVATEEAEIVAFASYGPYNPRAGYSRTVESSIYVAAGRRGRGIGRALVSALLSRAAAQGRRAIIAAIESENQASLALHAKLGFFKAGRLPEVGWKFERWLDLVLMEKLL